MAADIHIYVEYDEGNDSPFSDPDKVYGFSEGEFLVPRDYELFSVLAGVRFSDEFQPLYPPRGMPEIASKDAINAYHLNVLDNESERLDAEDVMRSQADIWVNDGLSQIRDSWIKQHGFVSDPNFHTPSWLYLEEVKQAYIHSPFQMQDGSKEMLVIMDLLQSIENHFGARRARIVFWFDN